MCPGIVTAAAIERSNNGLVAKSVSHYEASDEQAIDAAAARLLVGGLVAFPTETVFGLGADALNETAVRGVYEIKGRPSRNPLIVHVSGVEAARRLCADGAWDARCEALTSAFWPGPLTIVVPKSERVPELVTGGGANVGIRCPRHGIALRLLRAFERLGGVGVVGPSANRSGYVSPTTAAHVREAFNAEDVMVLDDGEATREVGIESTVVRLRPRDGEGVSAEILRPGAVSAEAIGRVLRETGDDRPVAMVTHAQGESNAALPGPGLLDVHYAPRATCRLVPREQLARSLDHARRKKPDAAVVVVATECDQAPAGIRQIVLPGDAVGYARGVYSALREADAMGPDMILVMDPKPSTDDGHGALWDAIMDRLRRACAPA